MTGEALGVGDHDLIRYIAKHTAQCMNFGGGAAATRRRIGFVGNKNCLGRDLLTRNTAPRFGFRHQRLHHLADVLNIQTSAVESAVARLCSQHFADGPYSAFARGVGALHHHGRGTHANNHAVPPAVERNGGVCDHFVGGCRSAGQEPRTHPIDQIVGSDVVGRDYDDPLAAAGVNPVLGQRNTLGGACAGSVDLCVGTASADEFGELRMSHGQDSKQEATIENIRFFVDGRAQFADATVDFLHQNRMTVRFDRASEQAFEHCQLLAAFVVGVIMCHLLGERVVPGERGCKDHAGIVAHGVGQSPALG